MTLIFKKNSEKNIVLLIIQVNHLTYFELLWIMQKEAWKSFL